MKVMSGVAIRAKPPIIIRTLMITIMVKVDITNPPVFLFRRAAGLLLQVLCAFPDNASLL